MEEHAADKVLTDTIQSIAQRLQSACIRRAWDRRRLDLDRADAAVVGLEQQAGRPAPDSQTLRSSTCLTLRNARTITAGVPSDARKVSGSLVAATRSCSRSIVTYSPPRSRAMRRARPLCQETPNLWLTHDCGSIRDRVQRGARL